MNQGRPFHIVLPLGALLVFASCASVEKKQHYESARDRIIETHDAVYYGDNSPRLIPESTGADPKAALAYLSNGGVPAECIPQANRSIPTELLDSCKQEWNQALREAFQKKYFAATWDQISKVCEENMMACEDPNAFEYIVRSIHNAEIASSKASKLKSLDRWKDGLISDEDLLYVLGFSTWAEVAARKANRTVAQMSE